MTDAEAPPRSVITLTWADVESLVDHLAHAVESSGRFGPDLILAVARGGLVPGVMLSHVLGVPEVAVIRARLTANESTNAPKFELVRIDGAPPCDALAGRDVLVVDDVIGSGRTLCAVRDYAFAAERVTLATLVRNEANWSPAVPADVISARTVSSWVVFPWESRVRAAE